MINGVQLLLKKGCLFIYVVIIITGDQGDNAVQVAVVCLGLALQGLAPETALAAGLTTAAAPAPSDAAVKLLGVAFMLLSSLSYSFLGVSYDLLVRSEGPRPTHSEVMFYTAKIGASAPCKGFTVPASFISFITHVYVP